MKVQSSPLIVEANPARRYTFFLVCASILILLYLSSLREYLLFHSLVELFSVIIACGIFMFAWNARRFLDNSYFLVIGIAHLFVGILDAFHMLAYTNSGIFNALELNSSSQFWIQARYMQAVSLFIAPFFVGKEVRTGRILAAYTGISALLVVLVFVCRIFPQCYNDSVGLTAFKRNSEYVISAFFAASAATLWYKRRVFERGVLRLLLVAIILSVFSELLFIPGYPALLNILGHLLKLAAFYVFYKATIETGLSQPYDLLFRNLRQSEEKLRVEKEKAQKYLEVVPVTMLIMDREGRISYLNNKGLELLEASAQETIGKDAIESFVPDNFRPNVREVISGLLKGEVSRYEYFECPVLTLGGKEKLVAWHSTVLRDHAGEIYAILSSGTEITEKKKMEDALRESEQRYRSFVENFHGIAFRGSLDFKPIFFHGAVQDITGYTADDFVSGRLHWDDIICPEDVETIKESLEDIRTKAWYSGQREYRIIRSDGSLRWVHENIRNACDQHGTPQLVEGSIFDITDRKKAEAEIVRLASFPEVNPQPVCEVDFSGKVTYMNLASKRLFPELEQKGFGHPWLEGFESEVLPHFEQEHLSFWNREVKIGGSWFEQNLYFVAANNVIRVYGNDITGRKLVEDDLRIANQQLNNIIEFLPDATFVINKERRVIAWNKAIEEMTGVGKENMLGKGDFAYAVPFYGKPRPILIDIVLGVDDGRYRDAYAFMRRNRDTLVGEVFVPSLFKGKGAFIWIKSSPLLDDSGNLIGAIETVRDITDRKEAEAILRKDKEVFENLVKQRSKELLEAQRQLADAKHLTEIGALAATIAHELRNPLAAIRTAAYNIGKKTRMPTLESHLLNIEKKVLESDQIINNLLSYSRIKLPHVEKVQLQEILNECIKAAKDRFPKYKVSIVSKVNCPQDTLIEGDPLQLKELFNNLLNNSYESFHSKEGKIRIDTDCAQQPGQIVIRIEDNGAGISEGDIKKIWQPFFTTKSKGTGLGLTVCKQLVTLHNGMLDITSEKGSGTVVSIVLPLKKK